ncbi:MAG: metal-dependent phosphohydrolase [Spirochaetes bacterium]|nr:MAG: metal-dependent phosphohydrolase [Spirochaetota bacterium]
MKSVSVSNLPSNSYIDKPVFLDENYILLSPDVPVTEELKNRLMQWGYSRVLTDGIPTEAPPVVAMAEADRSSGDEETTAILNKDVKEHEHWEEAFNTYREMNDFLSKIFERYLEKGEINRGIIFEKIRDLSTFIKDRRKYMLRITDMHTDKHSYIVSQSVKTTIISLVLADVMKLPVFKQIDVGTAALLHEIGMIKIPERIYMSNKPLTPEEKKAIAAHPVLGFRILKEMGFTMPVTRAVLESHERIDGSGYPRGLTGDRISFYSKIIAVASSYVAIVSRRPFREALDGHTGIMDLLKNVGKQFDEQVIKVLVYTLSIYPIGTYVALSDGSKGVVVESDPNNPRHPIVKLLAKENGMPYRDQPILKTKKDDGIQIVRPLTRKEIETLQKKE